MPGSPLTSPETIQEAIRHDAAMAFHGCDRLAEQRWRDAAADRAGRGRAALAEWQAANAPRLVKARKSPTRPEATSFCNQWEVTHRGKSFPVELAEPVPAHGANVTGPGKATVIEHRPWANEYRIRTETDPGNLAPPEPQAGERYTDMLTERGARSISDSCHYVARERGGFTTFLTLTFDEQARQRLAETCLVPVYNVDADGFPMAAEKATEDKTGLGTAFDPAGQVAAMNPNGGALVDRDTGAPFTPLKERHTWSIQREASRFFDGLQRMYMRGWQYVKPVYGKKSKDPETGAAFVPIERWNTVKVPGSDCGQYRRQYPRTLADGAQYTPLEAGPYVPVQRAPAVMKRARHPETGRPYTVTNGGDPYTPVTATPCPLDYLWVAEAPNRVDQDTGEVLDEQNPHIHVMIRWRVPYRHFRPWAKRMERLWGHGMAHLEKIEKPEKAGAYVAKAAGYLCKAQGKDDQGEIRGNRYGISSWARAPGWIEKERYQLGVMGWLLAEASEIWERKHGDKIRRREWLKAKLANTNDTAKRKKIGQILERTRAEIEPLPRLNKYQGVFKGRQDLERFKAWARRQGFEDTPASGQWLEQWRQAQFKRRQWHPWQDVPEGLTPTGEQWEAWLNLGESGAIELEETERDWGLYADMGVVSLPGLSAAGL